MNKESDTWLKIEYAERTQHIDFPEYLELALEEDYAKNPSVYTDDAFRAIRAYLLISPKAPPYEIIEFIHSIKNA